MAEWTADELEMVRAWLVDPDRAGSCPWVEGGAIADYEECGHHSHKCKRLLPRLSVNLYNKSSYRCPCSQFGVDKVSLRARKLLKDHGMEV